MKKLITFVKKQVNVAPKLLWLYCLVYFTWGLGMNWFGAFVEIAKFTFWWQVVTCYIFYMVPISLVLRNLAFHEQYAYGLVAMAFLEFGGYALETSYAFPNNLLDQWFGVRNFSLGMALFFALYFPLGNWAVTTLYNRLLKN